MCKLTYHDLIRGEDGEDNDHEEGRAAVAHE